MKIFDKNLIEIPHNPLKFRLPPSPTHKPTPTTQVGWWLRAKRNSVGKFLLFWFLPPHDWGVCVCVCVWGGVSSWIHPPPIHTKWGNGTSVTIFCFFTCHFYTVLSEKIKITLKLQESTRKFTFIKKILKFCKRYLIFVQIYKKYFFKCQ